jgi:hypothetical protein
MNTNSYKISPHDLISSLSFNEYILIDCLKFNNHKEFGAYSYLNLLQFIALTKQGFLNIFNELVTILPDYLLNLFDNQVIFYNRGLTLIIKYAHLNNLKDNKDLAKYLINLPGLDFYKCYYDGVKMYCTPESVQCYVTDEVQYTGPLNLARDAISCIIYYDYFKFKKELAENNRGYIYQSNGSLKNSITDISFSSYFKSFPTKLDVAETTSQEGSKHMFTLSTKRFNTCKENTYKFIEEVIFENPISSLC